MSPRANPPEPVEPLRPFAVEVVDGFTHYLRPGTGAGRPPVLLLNGCALPAAGWLPVIEALPGQDVLALDRPGFADTAWDKRLPDLASEVAAVQRIIDGPGRGRRAILVAHSMAAFRAEALARLRPDLVAGLVLVDPSLEDYRDPGTAARLARARGLNVTLSLLGHARLRRLVARAAHRGFREQMISPGRLDPDIFRDPYARPEVLRSALAEWLSYRLQGSQLSALRTRTGAVRTPTSAIFAQPGPTRRHLRLLAAHLGVHDPTMLDDSGHLVMLDRPDAIAAAVDELVL
ncbi:pimeloyl-ACP methyl ester carboxylesterase [Brevibacterium epidermidis]|jgi:pimeloyl-ACP methyl ester carboxylesterase|uniref:Pimeloyl-ACP methyl ester carboxylesterase n=1 Tax=Brevibacterium epidermidis TaxID=1698 RepID=A0ABV4EKI8_BREEP